MKVDVRRTKNGGITHVNGLALQGARDRIGACQHNAATDPEAWTVGGRQRCTALYDGDTGNFPTVCNTPKQHVLKHLANSVGVACAEDMTVIERFFLVVVVQIEGIRRIAVALRAQNAERLGEGVGDSKATSALLLIEHQLQAVVVGRQVVLRDLQTCVEWERFERVDVLLIEVRNRSIRSIGSVGREEWVNLTTTRHQLAVHISHSERLCLE